MPAPPPWPAGRSRTRSAGSPQPLDPPGSRLPICHAGLVCCLVDREPEVEVGHALVLKHCTAAQQQVAGVDAEALPVAVNVDAGRVVLVPQRKQPFMLGADGGAFLLVDSLGRYRLGAQVAIAVLIRSAPMHVQGFIRAELHATRIAAGQVIHWGDITTEQLAQLGRFRAQLGLGLVQLLDGGNRVRCSGFVVVLHGASPRSWSRALQRPGVGVG